MMAEKWKIDLLLMEKGDIYFFYKPKKGVESVKGLSDVGRFYFILQPDKEEFSRFIVMGNKKMPRFADKGDKSWGIVQMVGGRSFGSTTINKMNSTKGASRPAGEGIYSIIRHRKHTHLLYLLELPRYIGVVQRSFDILKEANYIFLERGEETSPRSIDVPFSNFAPVNIDNLNRKGTEILLVGVGADLGRMGIKVVADKETLETSDLFLKLKLDTKRHPMESITSGNWV